jgi:hypothetical protein
VSIVVGEGSLWCDRIEPYWGDIMGKVTHHRWEECSYESLPQWVRYRLQTKAHSDLRDPHRWILYPTELKDVLEKTGGGRVFLRGKSFFYVCLIVGVEGKEIDVFQTIGLEKDVKYRTIYYRKLRYKSKEVCKYWLPEPSRWGSTLGISSYCERERHQSETHNTDDVMKIQDWLDEFARRDTSINPAYEKYGMEVYLGCGGNWCPRYEP